MSKNAKKRWQAKVKRAREDKQQDQRQAVKRQQWTTNNAELANLWSEAS